VTQGLDGDEPAPTDLAPSPAEVLIHEVRQRARLRRPRNLAVVAVIVVLVVGYFAVLRHPASRSGTVTTVGRSPSAAVLNNTNADIVSFRQSGYHPGFTLPPDEPVPSERGWVLGNGRVSLVDEVLRDGTLASSTRTVLSIDGDDISQVTTTVVYSAHIWMRSTKLIACAIACAEFLLSRELLANPGVITYLYSEGYREVGKSREIDGLRVVEYTNDGSGTADYWITPSSHLLVRIPSSPAGAGQFDFQWHAPTDAQKKLLTLVIPSGFEHFVPPASKTFPA
jgi:hypothetical protein